MLLPQADTEPIYWSWVRAIAAELVRQTPFRAQRCLNFLEILTICPRGPVPLPDSPTETRRRSRSELRCWLGNSPLSTKSTSILNDSRRRSRSELRGWSSSNSSDEDLQLSEFRSIQTTLLPKVEVSLNDRAWACSESSEGSDDSLPWGAGCRSSVDSIDAAPSIPVPDTREQRIQRYKEVRRRENEARSRRVLEEDAKRRKARKEENNNVETSTGVTETTQKCDRTCQDIKPINQNSVPKILPQNNNGNAKTIKITRITGSTRLESCVRSAGNVEEFGRRLSAAGRESSSTMSLDRFGDSCRSNSTSPKITRSTVSDSCLRTADSVDAISKKLSSTSSEILNTNRRNEEQTIRTTRSTISDSCGKAADSVDQISGRLSGTTRESNPLISFEKLCQSSRNKEETTRTTRSTMSDSCANAADSIDQIGGRLSRTTRESNPPISLDKLNQSTRSKKETMRTTRSTISDSFARAAASIDQIGGRLSGTTRESNSTAASGKTSPNYRNKEEKIRTTRSTISDSSPQAADSTYQIGGRLAGTAKDSNPPASLDRPSQNSNRTTTRSTTSDPFVRAAETVDAITRRLPPLKAYTDTSSSIVKFRELSTCHPEDLSNNNSNTSFTNHNATSTRSKLESPLTPGITRTDSGERRSRARERRSVRERTQIVVHNQIPNNTLKTTFLQDRKELSNANSRIPVASQDILRTSSNSRIAERKSLMLDRKLLSNGVRECRERGAISLPRSTTGLSILDEKSSTCELEVAKLFERCQRIDHYVPVREKLTLFESLSRLRGRLARSTEDLGRASSKPSPEGKQRARSLHDLNRAARSLPVREMCRLFEGEADCNTAIVISTNSNFCKEPPISILKNNNNNNSQDAPPCVRTSTRRKHYQK